MKHLKLALLILLGLFLLPEAKAQAPTNSDPTQTICLGSIKDYRVDWEFTPDLPLTGTPGSSYTWTLNPAVTSTASFTAPSTTNNISVNWGTTPAGIYVNALSVIETTASGCVGTVVNLTVIITPSITPTFTSIGPLCQNSVAPTLPLSSTNSPAITGTWNSAISTSSVGTTVYTFTPTAGQCASIATLSVTITPEITPTFAVIGPLCQNSVAPILPTSSTNSPAITGTWDAAISTSTAGTTVYTFTPNAGQCASLTTLSVTITPQITPTFAAIGPLCQNSIAPTLPTSSTNSPAITGTWNSAINTSTAGTTVYTFTPAAGQCATTATLSVTITPQITPTFDAIGPLCQNSVAPILPTSSTNSPAISGTWNAAISTSTIGSTVYTFTPTAGQCATTANLSVTIATQITPTFAAIGPLCQNSVAPILPTSSTNTPAITGTWDAVINTSTIGTTVYTFTPAAGQCASTATLSVTIASQITPTFAAIGQLCQNSVAPTLPTSSTNTPAITGTWNAAISTSTVGTTVYTFTPAAGQCASTATLSITIVAPVTPTFATIGPLCQNSVPPLLPGSSTNTPAITGTWNTAISTSTAGTLDYTFTPDAGQCATTATLSITVISQPTAVVDPVIPICSGDNASFTITGTPNGIVTYNINGGSSQTATINAGGSATVTISGATADQTLNLGSIALGSCSNSLIGTSSTVTVTPTPNTSPIFHD